LVGVEGLVVMAVYVRNRFAKNPVKKGRGQYIDFMPSIVLLVEIRVLVDCAVMGWIMNLPFWYMLDELASQGDVEDLYAAANSEDGFSISPCSENGGDFHLISGWICPFIFRVHRSTIELGIDVASAGEKETVGFSDGGFDVPVVGWNPERISLGINNGIEVVQLLAVGVADWGPIWFR
jgi:hypothetical protein